MKERNAMVQSKLLYSFVSAAYDVYENWGEGTPQVGMKRIAKIAHQNGIPVTWLVNSISSERCRDRARLNEYLGRKDEEFKIFFSVDWDRIGCLFYLIG